MPLRLTVAVLALFRRNCNEFLRRCVTESTSTIQGQNGEIAEEGDDGIRRRKGDEHGVLGVNSELSISTIQI